MADDASLVAIHNRRERDRDQLSQPFLEPGTRINSLTFTESQLRAERRRVIRVAVCLAALVVIVVATTCTQEGMRIFTVLSAFKCFTEACTLCVAQLVASGAPLWWRPSLDCRMGRQTTVNLVQYCTVAECLDADGDDVCFYA